MTTQTITRKPPKRIIPLLISIPLLILGGYAIIGISLDGAETTGILITTDGTVYSLTQDINESSSLYGIKVLSKNVTIDCKGFILFGANTEDSVGIYSDQFNTTIKNCIIENFFSGIIIDTDDADNANIYNNTITNRHDNCHSPKTGNICNGIFLTGSDNSTIAYNKIMLSNNGILLADGSNSNKVLGNEVNLSGSYGIHSKNGTGNQFLYNHVLTTGPLALYIADSSNYLAAFNTLSSNMSALYLMGSSEGNVIYNNATVEIAEALAIVENWYLGHLAENNTLAFNKFTSHGRYAGYIQHIYNNTFYMNRFSSNGSSDAYGTLIITFTNSSEEQSTYNLFLSNSINQTNIGPKAGFPLVIRSGSRNVFINNTIISAYNNSSAIYTSSYSNDNLFSQNKIITRAKKGDEK